MFSGWKKFRFVQKQDAVDLANIVSGTENEVINNLDEMAMQRMSMNPLIRNFTSYVYDNWDLFEDADGLVDVSKTIDSYLSSNELKTQKTAADTTLMRMITPDSPFLKSESEMRKDLDKYVKILQQGSYYE